MDAITKASALREIKKLTRRIEELADDLEELKGRVENDKPETTPPTKPAKKKDDEPEGDNL